MTDSPPSPPPSSQTAEPPETLTGTIGIRDLFYDQFYLGVEGRGRFEIVYSDVHRLGLNASHSGVPAKGQLHPWIRGIGYQGCLIKGTVELLEESAELPPDSVIEPPEAISPVAPDLPAPSIIALVSCVKGKQSERCAAKDLYNSQWFLKARACVEFKGWPWFILSAEHGLLSPDQVIDPYQTSLKSMNPQQRQQWGDRVMGQIHKACPVPSTLVVLAGELYRNPITEALKAEGYDVQIPMMGLGIGEQQKWLKEQVQPRIEYIRLE